MSKQCIAVFFVRDTALIAASCTFLVQKLEQQTVQQLPAFNSQALSITLWSMARLGHSPQPAFLEAVLGASQALLPNCNAHDTSTLLWALASLGACPSDAWVAAFDARSAAVLCNCSIRQVGGRWCCLLRQSISML